MVFDFDIRKNVTQILSNDLQDVIVQNIVHTIEFELVAVTNTTLWESPKLHNLRKCSSETYLILLSEPKQCLEK